MEYTRHKLSEAFPSMSKSEHDELTADIAKNGQIDPITIYQGEVLDGWHRYTACVQIGIDAKLVCLADGIDPVVFVISRNMHRRHLTGSQRAVAVAVCATWAEVRRPKINMEPGATLKEMAKAAEVSQKTMQQAKTAVSAGLGDKVRDGELTVKKAAETAKPLKPIHTPAPSPEIQPQEQPEAETITIPRDQYDEMQALIDESLENDKALEKMLDGNFMLEDAVKTIKQQTSLIATFKSQLVGKDNKINELIKTIKAKDRQIAKLEKQIAEMTIAAVGI